MKPALFHATEQPALRGEYTKTYSVGPGQYKAFTSPVPLHVYLGDEWLPCDARFLPDPESGILTSHGSRFTTACRPSGPQAFLSVTDGKDHILSWGIADAKEQNPVVPETPKPEAPETGDNAEALFLEALLMAQGDVFYPEIFPGVDMYCHTDSRFEDSFVFSSAESVRPVTFRIETKLAPEWNPDGRIFLRDSSGESAFTILPPSLIDADGMNGPVSVEFETTDTGFSLSYSPDPDFTASAVYPVTLDPVVQTSESSGIADTYVKEGQTTNNSSSDRLWVTNNTNYGNRVSYVKVTSLPSIGSDHFITGATMRFKPVMAPTVADGMFLLAKEPLGDWQPSTITYANQPSLASVYQDGWLIPQGSYAWTSLDVTALAKKWYAGQNYGVALVPHHSSTTIVSLSSADAASSSVKPYFVLSYSSLAGHEDYLSYDSRPAGRAGTGYISLHNGNLVFAHSDTQMNGVKLPVSITHYYNSCDANLNEFYMGKGWRTNLHQTLHKVFLNNTVYYVWSDGDGTRHYFESSNSGNTEYRDLSGLGMKLAPGSSAVTVTDKGDNVLTFPVISATPTSSNPTTSKVLLSSIRDACGNTATITATGLKITKVTDGAGRETTFAYSSNLCSKIQTPWQTATACTQFAYSGSKLTTVTYEDHTSNVPKQSTYTYYTRNGYELLTGATGPEGISVAYTYTNTSAVSGLPYIVTRATVTGGSLTGSDTDYTYGHLLTLAYNRLSQKTIRYHFNDNGNLISMDDEAGYAQCASYDRSGSNENAPVNHATEVSRMQQVTTNLLLDGILNDNSSAWVQGGTGTFARDSSSRMWGNVSQKITITTGNTAYVRQQVTLTPGQGYTFSAWVKSSAPKAFLRISYTLSGSTVNVDSMPAAAGETDFQRISVSFTLPQAAGSTVYCSMMCTTTTGNAWFDALQLEKGLTLNHFNLLQNSDFSRGSGTLPDKWTASYTSQYTFAETKNFSQCTYTPPSVLTGRAVRVSSLWYATTGAYQQFSISGNTGDRFSAGGWCGGYARKNRTDNEASCRINVLFSSGGTDWFSGGTVDWNSTEGRWQYACGSIVAPRNYTCIRFALEFSRQVNYADFACVYLYPEAFGVDYVYDANGNRTAAETLFNRTASAQYDAFNNLTGYTAPGDTVSTTYNYGSTDAEKKKHLLLKKTTPLGTVTANTYNSVGGITRTDIKEADTSAAKFIRANTAYTSNNNYTASRTDARNKTVSMVTDANKGTVTSVTDANGQQANYTYDTMRRLTQASTTVSGNTHKTEYTYDAKDCLTQVKHNTTGDTSDVTYNFVYDALGRQTQAKVGSQALSTNTYTNSGVHSGTVSKVTYGNGHTVDYTYDGFNRVKGVKWNSESTPRYEYEYNAKGQAACLTDRNLNRIKQSEYDLADRPCRIRETEGGSHLYTGDVRYDAAKGNLQSFTEFVGSGYTKYKTTFAYDSENRPTTLNYGDTNHQTVLTYDSLGRVSNRVVKVGGNSYGSAYSFIAGGHGTNSTTALVSTITQTGETLTYTYDNVGNISTVKRGSLTTKYTYDALGQLTRVDDPNDTTSGSTGTTWVYTYDRGGNILDKKRYAYTTGTVGTVLQTISYTYGDSAWKDKLTKYGTIAITYDAIGNPTVYGSWNYTWENGRQLKKVEYTDGTKAEFVYNAEGLRVQKKVTNSSGTVTTTNYTFHGSNLVHMVRGSTALHFFYDAQNRPAIVNYAGTKYAYIYSLQGDVLGLVDSTGTEVVRYVYDAWGKVLATTGTLASTVGAIQPFRYRGYIYDTEIWLYYLRSRYYNPNWGRFINADSLIQGNLFAYCGNDPINRIDENGKMGIAILSNPTIQQTIWDACVGIIATIFVLLSGRNSVNISPNDVNTPDSSISYINDAMYSSGVISGIEYAIEKAKTQELSKRSAGYETHHIVPWSDHRCIKARSVLEDAGIEPFTDERNKVVIPKQLHKFLNNDMYDISIDILFDGVRDYTYSNYSDNLEIQLNYNVCLALDMIRSALEFAACIIGR